MSALQSFIDKQPSSKKKAREVLAGKIGVKEITIRSWANGNRSPSKKHLQRLERATNGEVKAADFLVDSESVA
jgi:DNA-binding transcriptional regulator YdaS (Cro superfamily)